MIQTQMKLPHMERENIKREERKQQLARIIHQQGRGGITLRQLCKLAGVVKSPYTREIVSELVCEHRATWDWAIHANGKQVRVFFPGELL